MQAAWGPAEAFQQPQPLACPPCRLLATLHQPSPVLARAGSKNPVSYHPPLQTAPKQACYTRCPPTIHPPIHQSTLPPMTHHMLVHPPRPMPLGAQMYGSATATPYVVHSAAFSVFICRQAGSSERGLQSQSPKHRQTALQLASWNTAIRRNVRVHVLPAPRPKCRIEPTFPADEFTWPHRTWYR